MSIRRIFRILVFCMVLLTASTAVVVRYRFLDVLFTRMEQAGGETSKMAVKAVSERVSMFATMADGVGSAVVNAFSGARANGTSAVDAGVERILAEIARSSKARGALDVYIGFEEDGKAILASGFVPSPDFDARKRPWYEAAVKAGGPVLTAPYLDVSTGRVVVTVATPVRREGKTMGVAGLDMLLEWFEKFVPDIRILGDGFGMLLDENGLVVVAPSGFETMKPVALSDGGSGFLSALRSGRGAEKVSIDGEPYSVFVEPVSESLRLAVFFPWRVFAEAARSMTLLLFLTGGITIVVLGAFLLVSGRKISRDVGTVASAAFAASEGKLSAECSVSGSGEIATIASSFGKMLGNLRAITASVRRDAEKVEAESRSLASTAEETSATMDESATTAAKAAKDASEALSMLAAAASSVGRISDLSAEAEAKIRIVSEGAGESTKMTGEAAANLASLSAEMKLAAESGRTNRDAARRLSEKVGSVSELSKAISGIADRTNLLALNAAIEAARAGEQGRGFAVVADEVRGLAETSSKTAANILRVVEELEAGMTRSMDSVESVVRSVESAAERAEAVRTVVLSARDISEKASALLSETGRAAKFQASESFSAASGTESALSAMREVLESVSGMRDSAVETSKAAEDVAESASRLLETAGKLAERMEFFSE